MPQKITITLSETCSEIVADVCVDQKQVISCGVGQKNLVIWVDDSICCKIKLGGPCHRRHLVFSDVNKASLHLPKLVQQMWITTTTGEMQIGPNVSFKLKRNHPEILVLYSTDDENIEKDAKSLAETIPDEQSMVLKHCHWSELQSDKFIKRLQVSDVRHCILLADENDMKSLDITILKVCSVVKLHIIHVYRIAFVNLRLHPYFCWDARLLV